jgi:putative phage-type endonuclease
VEAVALIRTKDMDRLAWLKARQAGIGGSDVSAIMGLNRWKSPIDVWVEKTTSVQDEEPSEAAYWGMVLEDVVAIEFQKRTGLRVRRRNSLLRHKDYPYMLANIDREIVSQDVGLECKTASEYRKDEWSDEEIPAEYILQCQHYMAVTGYKAWWIAILIGGNKFAYKLIERDEEIIRMLIEQEGNFWHQYVEPKVMPPVDGSEACKKALAKMYPQSNGQTVALDAESRELLEQRAKLEERSDLLKWQLNQIDSTIKAKLGKAEIGETGCYRVSWKTIASSKPDTKILKEQYPDVYKACLKTSDSRRFTVKEIE